MSFRILKTGSFSIALLLGSVCATTVQAQYPFGAPTCSNGYGYQSPMQSFYGNPGYGQPGLFQNLNGNFGSHYYPPSNYPAQVAYLPQPPMSYGGGYPPAAVNVSQSFYPSRYGNDPSTSSHHHSSHHPWHLGHYLMGHH